MTSIVEFARAVSAAPPMRAIQLLMVVAASLLLFLWLSFSGLKEYTAPDLSRLSVVEGRISGYPDTWEHNRSLIHIGVAYQLDGQKQGKPVYLYQEQFAESGLRINSKVRLTVERLDEGSVVREMATQDGRVLFDDRFNQQVVAWNNQSIASALFFGSLVIVGLLVTMLVIVLRNWREIFRGRPETSSV